MEQGIRAALSTWPHLQQQQDHNYLGGNNDNDDDDDDQKHQWLRNKMAALAHVMTKRPGLSPTVDYAMLARLLLEEQLLDQGRSVGKSGNYASQFHPATSSSTNHTTTASSSTTRKPTGAGSRPLTVGEIDVNWVDGACLSETLVARYHVNGKNPLTILHEFLVTQCSESSSPQDECDLPVVVDSIVCDALADGSLKTIILRVGHSSDLRTVQQALLGTPLEGAKVSRSVPEALLASNVSLLVLYDDDDDVSVFQNILCNAPEGSTVYIVDSCWKTLQTAKRLFGDNLPRGGGGRMEKADVSSLFGGGERYLSLNLFQTHASSVSQRNDAEMDPWTHLMGPDEFVELVSARIVTH